MKKVSNEEYKKILVEILEYVDKVCRENNINYSLIGGSLIGAVRHKGIIPWDDDIDIILFGEEYEKLLKILEEKNNDNNKFLLITNNVNNSYKKPFAKVVNTETTMVEQYQKPVDNYGVYIDIFKYNYVSNNKLVRFLNYKRIHNKVILFQLSSLTKNYKNPIKQLIKTYSKNYYNNKQVKKYCEIFDKKGKNNNCKFMQSNWPIYGFEKEIQKVENFKEFIDVPFENIIAMISKNYDEILRTTFGDYMQLPPEEKRRCHNNEAYWKE